MTRFFQTDRSATLLFQRLILGLVILPHGAQKLLGLFGGHGFAATMQGMTSMGLPAVIVLLVMIAEFFGAIGLVTGFLGRVAAFGIFCVMVGAILTVHLHNGFFMNWEGTQKGEGFEYHLLAIGMAVAVMVKGSGRLSVDRSMTPDRRIYR